MWSCRTFRILFEGTADEGSRVEWLGYVFPIELALADDFSGPHRHQRKRKQPVFAVIAKDVDVVARDVEHLLLLAEALDCAKLIAISRGPLVPQLVRRPLHTLAEAGLELGGLAAKQKLNVSDRFIVLVH